MVAWVTTRRPFEACEQLLMQTHLQFHKIRTCCIQNHEECLQAAKTKPNTQHTSTLYPEFYPQTTWLQCSKCTIFFLKTCKYSKTTRQYQECVLFCSLKHRGSLMQIQDEFCKLVIVKHQDLCHSQSYRTFTQFTSLYTTYQLHLFEQIKQNKLHTCCVCH